MVDKSISRNFKKSFSSICHELLISAYFIIRNNNSLDKNGDEDDISVHFISNMENLPLAIKNKIDIRRQENIDTLAILNQNQKAITASRVDIYFKKTTWTSPKQIEGYAVEAKNVSEKNWKKANGVAVPAAAQRQGYINKGIIEFVQGNYPPGCMVAYVLNGNIAPIVTDINTRITNNSHYLEKKMGTLAPSTPITIPSESSPFTEVYDSLCANQPNNKLKHFFFDLT